VLYKDSDPCSVFVSCLVGWLVRQPLSGHDVKYVAGLPFKLKKLIQIKTFFH
jgi:hypothetical protein